MKLIQKFLMRQSLKRSIRLNKQRAKRLKLAIEAVTTDLSCGIYLARHIHPDLEGWENEYESIMHWLKINDPDFPESMK